jgi:hypothetical protein
MDNLWAPPLIFSSGTRPLGKNRAWKAMHRLEKILLRRKKMLQQQRVNLMTMDSAG